MQSIFAKLRVVTLSNIHTLLDYAKGLNSIGEYEQYVRDVQSARDQIDDQAAAERAHALALHQKIDAANARIISANAQIDALLGDDDPTNDKFATPLQIALTNDEKLVTRTEAELKGVQDQVDQYDQAVSRLDVTLAEANGKLEELRDLERNTKTQTSVAKTLNNVNIGSAPDTENVESKMRQNAAVASNQAGRALDRVSGAVGGVTPAEAAAQAALALRKQKLAAAKAPGAETASVPA